MTTSTIAQSNATTYTLEDLVREAWRGRVRIPEFQRPMSISTSRKAAAATMSTPAKRAIAVVGGPDHVMSIGRARRLPR